MQNKKIKKIFCKLKNFKKTPTKLAKDGKTLRSNEK